MITLAEVIDKQQKRISKPSSYNLALPQYPSFLTNILPTVGSPGPGPLCRLNHTTGFKAGRDLKEEAVSFDIHLNIRIVSR